MRVTIRGITPSTITFNSLGIIVRGDSNNPELYPESVARHINVVNEEQLTEVNSLVNAGLISIEVEAEDAPKPNPVVPERIADVTTEEVQEVTVDGDDGVEDVQQSETVEEPEEPEEEILTVEAEEKPKPKRRGRPKGSKDKKPRKTTKKKATKKSTKKKAPKKVAKAKPTESDEPNSSVVVMTPAGAVEGEMKRTFAGEIEDNERTAASIEAMKKLEEEEAEDIALADTPVDESKLDPSEQMGRKAIIATGEKETTEVEMKNSIVPEADQIKERGVEFIDKDEKKTDNPEEAFIDDDKDDDEDDMDFLEC